MLERRLGSILLGAACLAVGAFVACVGDDPGAEQPTNDSGSQGGDDASSPSGDSGTPQADSGQPPVDSGGGNDAGTFVPSDLPGLTLWLDATRGLAADSNVTNWVDQATLRALKGDGVFVDGGTCVPPTRVDGEIKGNPVVRFNGTNNCLVMGSTFYDRFRDFRKGLTVFIVAKPGTAVNGDDEALLDFSPKSPNSTDWVSITRDGENPNYNVQNPMYGSSLAASSSSAFIAGQTHVVTTLVQPGDAGAFGSAGSVSFFIDGAPATSSSTPTVYVPSVENRSLSLIGRFVPGNGMPTGLTPGWYRGDIGEVVMYLRTLSTDERAKVQSYLNAKWLP